VVLAFLKYLIIIMYTKKKKFRKYKKQRLTKKNKNTKKGGIGSDSKYTSVKKTLKPPSFWRGLPSRYSRDSICRKVPAKNPIVKKCEKYNDKWVDIEYNIENLTHEESPILLFKEGADFSELADGIHNFILYWDDEAEYTLATAYFNAVEYGSKHNMIAKRTEKITPETFIISGEIKKDGNKITFHDVSSQYFVENKCNISQQMLKITVYEEMEKNGWSADSLTPDELIQLKQTIIATNNFTKPTKDEIMKADFNQFIKILVSRTPGVKGPIYKNYIDIITAIMRDAFERIFDPSEPINIYYEKFKDYGSQKDMDTFIQDKCRLSNPVEFNVYDNERCIGEINSRTCSITTPKIKRRKLT
jgi:hypothetical protein